LKVRGIQNLIRLLLYLILWILTLIITGCSFVTSDEGLTTQKEHINKENENNTDYKRIEVELAQPYDGDTIAVIYKIHPRLGEQPYGKEAKEFTRSLVENTRKIELEFDIGPQ
jgi:micrococcal nuclease